MTTPSATEAKRDAPRTLDVADAATMRAEDVLPHSIRAATASRRRKRERASSASDRTRCAATGAGAIAVLVGQLRSPFLLLLLATAVASAFFGERTDAIIIFLISGLSVGLGFVSEYRSARAVEALRASCRSCSGS